MEVIKTIKPNAAGAKRHQEKWNEKLVAVRYRVDREKGKRYTTVELIVDERSIPAASPHSQRDTDLIAAVKIFYREEALRAKIRSLGAQWNNKEKLWYLPLKKVKALNLETRIVFIDGKLTTRAHK